MVVRISDKTQNYSKVTKLLVKPIINNVSTASALEVGNLMKQHMHARQIIKTIKENYEMSYQFIESKQKTEAILTVCATGFGSAKKIGELLKNSLPKSIPLEIIPYDYRSLVTHGIEDNIFSEYDVKMLIGTLDPKVPGVKYRLNRYIGDMLIYSTLIMSI